MNRQTSATAKKLQRDREAKDLSREGLAFLAGVSLRTIERIEAGDSTPRRATLAVIQKAIEDHEPTEAAA